MLTVEGTCENGKIEFVEHSPNEVKKTQVLVTFVETKEINLRERGIDVQQMRNAALFKKTVGFVYGKIEHFRHTSPKLKTPG